MPTELKILTLVIFLTVTAHQDGSKPEMQSDRQKAGYLGPVHKVIKEGETVSRKEYFPAKGANPERMEDTSKAFGVSHPPTDPDEEEFDENGRLIADASLEREMEQGAFRYVYKYDDKGRISEESQFNRDHSAAGRTAYVYGASGKKAEEVHYGASGEVIGRTQFDEHGNEIHIDLFGRDRSITRNETITHSYKREGNTLEDSYVPPQVKPGEGMQFVPSGAQEVKGTPSDTDGIVRNRFTYADSGQLIREEKDGWVKEYDTQGRVTSEVFGPARTTYSYDEQGREKEVVTDVEAGAFSSMAEYRRTVSEYDSHGNEIERTVYHRQGEVFMHFSYSYEYDTHGNWTKRVETELVFNGRQGGVRSTLEIITAANRTISYY